MTWNYRMVQRNQEVGIYSVYYDSQGRAEGVSLEPQKIIGVSVEALAVTLEVRVLEMPKTFVKVTNFAARAE